MSSISKLTKEQRESINEVINMGMEAGCATLSSILSKEIEIFADRAEISEINDIDDNGMKPALIAGIENTGAIEGKCMLVIRNMDIQTILNIFMNGDMFANEDFDLDELSLGTIRELINQCIASFSSVLTEFLGNSVKMRLLEIRMFENNRIFSDEFMCMDDTEILNVNFELNIDNLIKSNFICIISDKLTDSLNSKISMSNKTDKGSMRSMYSNSASRNTASGDNRYNNSVSIQKGKFPDFSAQISPVASTLLNGNMDILMDVPLNVTIEIGKTKKKMKEILEFAQGTIIALEKQAGAPVDVVVNGQLIARGDVVVIDDNFGVRITEVIGAQQDMTSR
jgi:flagellar motor switch protein FliN/FliY